MLAGNAQSAGFMHRLFKCMNRTAVWDVKKGVGFRLGSQAAERDVRASACTDVDAHF